MKKLTKSAVLLCLAVLLLVSSDFPWRPSWPVPERARWRSGYAFHDIRWPRHRGHDFGAWLGCPIYAVDGGKVVYAGWWGAKSYGNLIIIDHQNGWQTWYAHLSKVEVSRGQTVQRGIVIGRAGSTGFSTGPHLHFEAHFNDEAVDPATLFGGQAMSKDNEYVVYGPSGKERFRGSEAECFRYVLNHQSQSVYYATKYCGWKIVPAEDKK